MTTLKITVAKLQTLNSVIFSNFVTMWGTRNENIGSASLHGFASTLGYSEKYAGRMIKEHLGASFSELLLSYKLQKAVQLIEGTDLPIDEIAREAGYNNPSGLYKQFFASYGMTPNAYRKMTE